MAYRLGVDLGTTYTAAALNLDGRVEMLSLGNRATQIASVVYVKEDGTVLIGEPAEYRGAADPTRLAREFKRRIGGVVPIIIGGSPYSPQSLLARVLGWTVEVATRQQGEAPEHVCVTYPANWGPFKHEILEQVIKLAGLRGASTCTEPEAAAIAYASRDRVPEGAKLAVYDLGGGTFDAAVLVRDGVGFRLVGNPDGVEHLGGIDFDAAVLQYVLDQLGPAVQQLDDSDPATLLGLNRLRRDCVTAKETLSVDDEAVVPVALPGISTFTPITRAQFEEMVRPAIGETVAAMGRSLGSAGVDPGELHAIVMVGGSSRIPLVGQELAGAFGRPLALDNHPKHDVALGAAIRAMDPAQPYAAPARPRPVPSNRPGQPDGHGQPNGLGQPGSGQPGSGQRGSGQRWPGQPDGPGQPVGGAVPSAAYASAPPGPPSWAPTPPPPPQGRGAGPAAGSPPGAGWPGGSGGGHYPRPPYDPYRPDPYRADPHRADPHRADPYRGDARPSGPARSGQPDRSTRPNVPGARRWVVIGAVGVVAVLAVVLGILVIPRTGDGGTTPTSTTTAEPTETETPVAPVPGLPASPEPLPNDVIIWPHLRDGNWDISTITASGTTGPPLVASPAEDSFPVISPDRRTIIYTRSTGPGTRELRVMGADGSGERALFDQVPPGCENVTRPAFGSTPRPQLVLPCIDPATGDVTLTLVAPDGTVLNDLGRGWHSDPALAPDGKFVLYWEDNKTRGEGGAIMQQPVDLGAPVAITEGGRVRDNDPAVSPKNDLVAITRAGQGIWTVSLEARHTATQLTKDPTDQDPSWSPDATQITFKRRDEMWVMNADGSNPRRISAPGEIGTASAWSPR